MTEATPTLGQLIEVVDVETVVRLDGTGDRLRELVLTGDVTESLVAVLEAASGGVGAGFFVVGPFGSGKSHFLAAVGELLADPAAAWARTSWEPGLRRLAAAARASTIVAVPLVEYRSGAALEDVVAERAWRALSEMSPAGSDDRTASWDAVLAAATAQGRHGVVILLDELSEFLRAKQGPQLTEDLRFLQFLGEWVATRPVLVLAALQESIEEVANVSQRELARIRDRYRPSLALSMRHVEDLVQGRLVRLRPDAGPWVDRAWQEITAAFPDDRSRYLSRDQFARCYPLHPETLSLLEGLRFLLSQQRGVVDFISHRLHDVLGRGYAELVTPDEVFDHFRSRLLERPESARLAETVVPYYERVLGELFGDDEDDRRLALRAVKLLSLLAASPLERPRTAADLAAMLVVRVSDVDPTVNVTYLERAILDPIVRHGAYIVATARSAPTTYAIELDADATLVAKARADQMRAELSTGDRRLVTTLCHLGSSPQLPLQLLAEVGIARREFLWHNTQRSLMVGVVRVLELGADDVTAFVAQARSAGAEGCLLIGEVEMDEAEAAQEKATDLVASVPRLALWVPAAFRADERAAVLDMHSRVLLLEAVRREGRADLVEVVQAAGDADAAVAREILRRVYFEGQARGVDLPSLAGLLFERQLSRLADPLLSALHPQHRAVAPLGELVGDRLVRQLIEDVIVPGRVGPAGLARGQTRPLIEGYLVPLGLARIRNDGATVAPDPARSPAVAEVLRLVGDGDPVAATDVVQALADGPIGLSPPETILVLNACVQNGLLEAWRGRRRNAEAFLGVTATDRLGAGELVEPAVREAVAALGPITGPGPLEPWTAGAQRRAWDHARSWLDARREEVLETRADLLAFGEVPALAGADPGPVLDDLATVGAVIDACPPSSTVSWAAPVGLRRLVAAIPDAESVLAAAPRLAAVCRFLRDELRRVEETAAYLTHPELTIPDSDPALRSLRDAALDRLRQALQLAAQDRAGDLFAANREFRSAYFGAYQEAHDRYYASVTADDLAAARAAPAYRALARLSAIGAVAVPDDRVKVDRLLAGSAPPPCPRPVNVELRWKPRCSCGLGLGDEPPVLDLAAVAGVAHRGVRQYFDELATPELADRLRDAVVDLHSLGRSELATDIARLQAMAAGRDEPARCDEAARLGDGARPDAGARLDDGARLHEGVPRDEGVPSDQGARADQAVGADRAPRPDAGAGPGQVAQPDQSARTGEVARTDQAVRLNDQDQDQAGLPDLAALAALLTDDVVTVLRDILSGGQLIVSRDLATLREDLIGRRYPKRKLLEILAAWVDAGGTMPPGGFVQVIDSSESPAAPAPSGNDGTGTRSARPGSGTVEFLAKRFPGVAALLPAQHSADVFWLAAWWAGRASPPPWLPTRLLADPDRLRAAAAAAIGDLVARTDLADLDARVGPNSLLGDQVEAVLDLGTRPAGDAAAVLSGERLLRHPVRLAADQLVRRMASDWQLAGMAQSGLGAAEHALLTTTEMASWAYLVEAAGHLDALEHAMADQSVPSLVERLYPAHYAPVRALISRAELATVGASILGSDAVGTFRSAAERLLDAVDGLFRDHGDAGFPGCLRVWEVGDTVIGPLLERHGRVAILLVDAMRADLAGPVMAMIAAALPGRTAQWRWAVVPSPTRTAESIAAMHLGRPVAAGEMERPTGTGEGQRQLVPFAHLGYEAQVVVGVDRDARSAEADRLWATGPPISVAVATGVDERLHRTSVELAALLDEAAVALKRRVVPSLTALPSAVPLVVLADHGFRENRFWGKGPQGRYVHGGTSLEECVIPVVVFEPPAVP